MKQKKYLFIGALILIVVAVLSLGGGWLVALALRSDNIIDQVGIWPTATPFSQSQISAGSVDILETELEAAGLTPDPYLDAAGINTHLARLAAGEIDPVTLTQYAADLQYLNEATAKYGAQIPASFWDVRTDDMDSNNVTEYSLVNSLAQPALDAYIGLLARSFARFKTFKQAESTQSDDTALDAALDMLLYTIDYLDEELGPLPAAASKEARNERASEAVRIWQSLLVGTTRYNPITGKDMVAQTLSSRLTVVEMWGHAQGKLIHHTAAWGVSGFDQQFVGTPINNNQIEHMSISMFLQQDLIEPELVLDLEEDKELLTGHSAQKAMANADMALNNAIAAEFIPYFANDMRRAVEHLRCYLKATCDSWQ